MAPSKLKSTVIAGSIAAIGMADFVYALDTDAQLQVEYKNDPVATATNFGLNEADIELIANENWQEIAQLYENISCSPKSVDHW